MRVSAGMVGGQLETDLTRTWRVDAPASGRRFGFSVDLKLATGGHAEALNVLPNSRLVIGLRSLTFDARATDAPERATVTNDGDGVRLDLPVARRIQQVLFKNSVSPGGKTVTFHRTDGDVVAEDPVQQMIHPLTVVLQGPVQDVQVIGQENFGGAGIEAVAVVDTPSGISATQRNVGRDIATDAISRDSSGISDSRIVVRLAGTDVGASDVAAVKLLTFPENARVGVALLELADEIFYLPDAIGSTAAEVGGSLATQLQALLDRFRDSLSTATLPADLTVRLVIESDAPCLADITALNLGYRLARASFPDGKPKAALKFSGDVVSGQQVLVEVPGDALIIEAELVVTGANLGSNGATGEPVDAPLVGFDTDDSRDGVSIAAEAVWAMPLEISTARTVDGCLLAVAGTTSGARFVGSLVEDAAGTPGGAILATATSDTLASGVKSLVRLNFQPTVLSTGIVWLVVRVVSGAGVWFTEVDGSAGLLRLDPATQAWVNVRATEATRGIVKLLDIGILSSAPNLPTVQLGDVPVRGASVDRGIAYDLKGVLEVSLPQTPGLVPLALTVAASTGTLTVQPLAIEYDLIA